MNSRSPRVVTSGRKPLRATVGERNSHTVMPTSTGAMHAKKIATGGRPRHPSSVHHHTLPIAKPFAM